ncbi:MAG: TonB-dependent receptor plug domain-containing protein [Flavobacterium sp.]|nr:TonB-dependent receptor plug domain-containing protein [Flavobacterium sp.]
MKTKIVILMVSLFSVQIVAQSKQDSIYQLKNITINARPKILKEQSEFKRHGQSTELLSSQELNRNNPAFLEQSLGVMAGVQVDKRTQAGGQRIVIRGYGNDQKFNNWGIKAYYNQIPLTNAEGVTILDDVDFSVVDNIEVVKGPASTMYGAGVGGVVRFYLKNSDEKGISLTQNTTTGSFNLVQTNTRLDLVTDNASMFVNFGHLESDGYRPNGQSLKNFITYKGDFKFSDKQSVNVFLSHNFSHEGISGQIPYSYYYANNDPGNQAYLIKNSHLDMQSTRFGVSNNYKLSNTFINSTVLFYSGTDSERVVAGAYEQASSPNYGIRSVFTKTNGISNEIENVLDFGTEIQQCKSLISNFRFTGDINNPLTVSPIAPGNYYKYTTNQQSVFIHDRINFKKYDAALILGLSANHIDYDRIDLLALPGLIVGNTKNTSFSKSFTTSYNPHVAIQKTYKDQIFNLSYSEGYNAPTASTSFIAALNKTNDELIAEKAKMVEFSAQGLLFNTRFDYQVSLFNMNIENKLTQLSAANPAGGSYTYTANTGNQMNKGLEASIGYVFTINSNPFLSKVTSFVNFSYYDFKYTDFSTRVGGILSDFSNKKVVGVPKQKYSVGLDFQSPKGIYLNSTYNYLSEVYSDFANTNSVNGFGLLNAKLGYKIASKNKKISLDFFVAGNNLTNQTNYTFLFLGGSINDFDAGNGFPTGMAADVNPGSSKAYFWNGINLKYHF